MVNTWTALLRTTYNVPDVHSPCSALVDQFGEAEPSIRQIGSALGVIAMDERIGYFLEDNDPMALEQVRSAFRRYIELANSYDFMQPSPFENRTERGNPLALIGHRLTLINDLLPQATTVRWYTGRIEQQSDGRFRNVLAAVSHAISDGSPVVVAGSYGDTEQMPDEVAMHVLTGPHAARFAASPQWGGGFWTPVQLVELSLP